MARLPSGKFLIQQIGNNVILFEDHTEVEIVRFDVTDRDAVAKAQGAIHNSALNVEDKTFAHFWSGYFYAHSGI